MAVFQIGDVILGKYEVTQVLGQGGMGIVFAARHRELDAPVALKFLLPSLRESPQSAERFAAEARTAMRLKSEHVVRVYDVATVDGAPFIVMEYLTGQDLSKVIAARVAAGDLGSHFQRDRRCPGTHPLARRRFFALASRDAGRAWSTRSAVAARPE